MTAASESAQDEAQQYAEQAEEAAMVLKPCRVSPFDHDDGCHLVEPCGAAPHCTCGAVDEQAEEKDALADLQRRYGDGPTRQGGDA